MLSGIKVLTIAKREWYKKLKKISSRELCSGSRFKGTQKDEKTYSKQVGEKVKKR
jgi:hypothetical protein